MNYGDLLHNLHCPDGNKCYSANPNRVVSIDQSKAPANDKYDSFAGGEVVLFHGTSDRDEIEKEGFSTRYCGEKTLGVGIHMSPCLRMSNAFSGRDGTVYVCKVKVGRCQYMTFDDFPFEYKGQDTTISPGPEYTIYDVSRIKIIGILNMK